MWRWIGYFFVFLLAMVVAGTGYAAKYVWEQYQALPGQARMDPQRIVGPLSTIIYDRDGNEIWVLSGKENEQRVYVPLKDIPKHVQDAFIAIEDARFWQHRGFDPRRLIGAAWVDLKYLLTGEGDIQGASTITQQLAKNAYDLDRGRKISRKVQELLLAIQMERNLSKEEILESYLNEIYFGRNYYGIGMAAKMYFGKHPRDLTVAEAALLAGMVQRPNAYDPLRHPEAARERQELVLAQMVRWGFLTPEEEQAARSEKLTFAQPAADAPQSESRAAGYFVDYVIRVLTDREEAALYGIEPIPEEALFRGGYRIYTTFDPKVQAIADEAVARVMDPKRDPRFALDGKDPQDWVQVGVAVMRPSTGEVLALVGGRRRDGMRQLNRATDTLRQPGSAMKPLAAYTPAFELLGWGPGTVVDDVAYKADSRGNPWPQNYGGQAFNGLVPVRRAVEQSLNAAAVQTIAKVGPARAIEIARLLGVRHLVTEGPRNDVQLAAALGGLTSGVSVLELTAAYSTLANLGLRVDPVVVTRIVDRDGKVIFEAHPRRRQVIKESTAWLMVDTLKGVIRRGTAASATRGLQGWPAAGKTGTTEKNTDAWFVGFTRDLAVGVWNGYDNPGQQAPRRLWYTGGGGPPTQIWTQIMLAAHPQPPPDWERPSSVVPVQICARTGLLPSAMCPQVTTDWFARGTEPAETDYPRFWTDPIPVVREQVQDPDGSTREVWRRWQPGCPGIPELRSFLIRPEFPRNPSNPNDPRFFPKDLAETAPTQVCTGAGSAPGGLFRGFPGLPGLPGLLPDRPQPPDSPSQPPPGPANGKPPAGAPPAGGERSGSPPAGQEERPGWLSGGGTGSALLAPDPGKGGKKKEKGRRPPDGLPRLRELEGSLARD